MDYIVKYANIVYLPDGGMHAWVCTHVYVHTKKWNNVIIKIFRKSLTKKYYYFQ